MTSPELIRLTVTTPAAASEGIMARALAHLGGGCEERDLGDGTAALVFWVPPARRDRAAAFLGSLGTPEAPVRVESADQDPAWRDAMRAFHRPIVVADRLRVRPPWVAADPRLPEVVIDPGMAFGTGQHATTAGCLDLLTRVPPAPAVDVGCGSGVLAIAARRLGFEPVWAVDNDPLAVEATIDNARVNGVALTVARRAIGVDPLPVAPVLLANLTADLLTRLAAVLRDAPPRWAVVSGLRPAEEAAVLQAWEPLGLTARDRRGDGEWSALLLAAAGA